MKTSDLTLRNTLYNANLMVAADLVDVDLAIGHQRWTTAGANVVVGGVTYYADRPVIGPGTIRSAVGLEVATCDLRLEGQYQISGRTLANRALVGEFDNRDVALRRIFMPNWSDTPSMAMDVFSGRVAEVLFNSYAVELRLKSIMYKAEEQRPLRVAQAMCPWVLYDANCGASQGSFSANDTVAAGSTQSSVVLTTGTSLATPGGTIQFVSGTGLDGATAVIRSYNAGSRTATLVTTLASVPQTGGSVTVSRGCDRTRATCGSVFNRLVAFGGFPDMPSKTP